MLFPILRFVELFTVEYTPYTPTAPFVPILNAEPEFRLTTPPVEYIPTPELPMFEAPILLTVPPLLYIPIDLTHDVTVPLFVIVLPATAPYIPILGSDVFTESPIFNVPVLFIFCGIVPIE